MIDKEKISKVLDGVVHPETGMGLGEGKNVAEVTIAARSVGVVLKFRRARDPFASSLARQASDALAAAFPDAKIGVTVDSPTTTPEPSRRLPGIAHAIAVASGKGGVGKSTVAAHLATTLAAEGYRVGVLDADIYGPSQPSLFGVSDYIPAADGDGKDAMIAPAESMGVKIMSIGFFIDPSDALVWRGPMATNALRQLIRQTAWGELDFLLIDLPPGTGDVHLTIVQELELAGAVVVSAPGELSVADVRRGVEMFRSEGIDVPVLGIIENMAWFTPAELPSNRYYIFGEGGARRFAETEKIEFLGDIPIVMSAADDRDKRSSGGNLAHPAAAPYYSLIAKRIVDKLTGKC